MHGEWKKKRPVGSQHATISWATIERKRLTWFRINYNENKNKQGHNYSMKIPTNKSKIIKFKVAQSRFWIIHNHFYIAETKGIWTKLEENFAAK